VVALLGGECLCGSITKGGNQMGKGRKVETIGRITKKDGEMMKAIARTGIISKANAINFLGQNDKRLRLMEKNGYVRSENVLTKDGGQTIYKLNSVGREYIKEYTNVDLLYRSNNSQIGHDLALNTAYFHIPESARETWLNESQIHNRFGNTIKDVGARGGIDAMVVVDGQIVGIEIITDNYGKIEISQKIEAAQAIRCDRMVTIKC
jgi:hypothetical protein